MNIYRGRTHTEFYLASLLYDAVEDCDIAAILALLREKHADPNLVLPRTGISPFHLAVGCGCDRIRDGDDKEEEEEEEEEVKEDDGDGEECHQMWSVLDTIKDGRVPFDLRCTQAMLLYGGANPNVRSDEGLTPLHIAAAWGRLAIVQLLLRCGANADITDNCYRSARAYAELEGHDGTARLLRRSVRQLEVAILADRLDEPRPVRSGGGGAACCPVVLDKIIISNGDSVAEYAVAQHTTDLPSSNTTNGLDHLPTTNVTEYVTTWCQNHQPQPTEHTRTPPSAANHKHDAADQSDDEDGGVGTSRDPTPRPHHPFVTVRPRPRPPAPANENRAIVRPLPNQKPSGGVCRCSDVSRESGIMTLQEDSSLDSLKGERRGEIKMVDLIASSFEEVLNTARVQDTCEPTNRSTSPTTNTSNTSPRLRTSSDYFTCSHNTTNPHNRNLLLHHHTTSTSTAAANLSSDSDCYNSAPSRNYNSDNSDNNNDDDGNSSSAAGFVSALNRGLIVSSSLSSSSPEGGDSGASGVSAASGRSGGRGGGVSAGGRVSVQEVYRYTDAENEVVLYEKVLLVPSQSALNQTDTRTVSSTCTSKLSSLPASFDYDTDTLRKELTAQGFEPGPITRTTKRVYIRKLYRLRRNPPSIRQAADTRPKYSAELERTLRNADWSMADLSVHLAQYRHLDEALSAQFRCPDAARRWREGNSKGSFTYLLLDPRVTQNLPSRTDQMPFAQVWQTFVSSIFYVGKGKRSRPYRHLYDALQHWHTNPTPPTPSPTPSLKLQRILSIWQDRCGVICLHVFLNVIPVEAYCREAAMIAALRKENLTNLKLGEFYGVSAAWSPMEKRQFGVYLLYRALQILLNDGERQLSPSDID